MNSKSCTRCKENKPRDISTGKFRGMLCHHCNRGLGNFKDNIQNLENAILYLKNKG